MGSVTSEGRPRSAIRGQVPDDRDVLVEGIAPTAACWTGECATRFATGLVHGSPTSWSVAAAMARLDTTRPPRPYQAAAPLVRRLVAGSGDEADGHARPRAGPRADLAPAGQASTRCDWPRPGLVSCHCPLTRRDPEYGSIVGARARARASPEPGEMPGRCQPPSTCTRPSRTAHRAACVRDARPSLPRMFETCVRAVRSLMPSWSAISLFAAPAPTSRRTSTSRVVRSALASPREARPARRAAAGRPRVELQLAAIRGAHGRRDLVGVGVLEDVSRRSGFQCAAHELVVGVGGQDDDRDVVVAGADQAGRLDAVQGPHLQVHDDHVGSPPLGFEPLQQVERLRPAVGRSDDLEVGLALEEGPQPATHDRMVVHHEHLDRVCRLSRHRGARRRARAPRSGRRSPGRARW